MSRVRGRIAALYCTVILIPLLYTNLSGAANPEDIKCFDSVSVEEGGTLGYHFESSANSCLQLCMGMSNSMYFSLIREVRKYGVIKQAPDIFTCGP